MEEALAPPPPPPFSAAASLRRSHLDSASYRTLSRLFSHCLHLRGSPQEAAASGAGDNSGNAGEPPRAQRSPPAPEEPEAVATESLPASKDAGFVRGAGAEEEAVVENPSSDGSCSKDGALAEEEEVLRSVKACLLAEDEKWVGEVLGNEDGQLLDEMVTGMSVLLDGVSNGVMPVQGCGVSEGELQRDEQVNVSAAEATELRGGTEEESPTGNSDHNRVDGGEFEEGEIEGDMQNLDGEALDSEAKDDDADDGKLEGDFISRGSAQDVACGHDRRSRSSQSALGSRGSDDVAPDTDGTVRDAQMHVTRVPAVSYEQVVAWNEAPLPGDEAPKPGKKRKRVLTEERKAKKTKNKRIKRAQQARAEGVKRLRLQPVVKAKVVQYCRFYLQGKCQQGDVCKYSHDTTPLTKSKPCTHFARGSCLKGDDCPYDHELSKYPCHNFLENGMCGRGDKCKFSHVMPTAEGPSSTPDAKKSDTPSPYDSTNFRKQISSQKTSMVSDGEPVISAPEKPYSILKNLADMSAKAQKAPARIPKGVRFLSFSKEGSDSSSLHQDTLPIEKQKSTRDCNGQKFGGFREEVEKIAGHSGQKPVPTLHAKNSISKATLHPSSEPKNASLSTDFAAASGSRSIQDEVSEASRILQEFLFGTGS